MRSVWDILQAWLMGDQARYVQISHGGEGGAWYAQLIDDNAGTNVDATGDTHEQALAAAWEAMQKG